MTDDASLLRRYLLGELDESELEAVERKLMVSDEQFQELTIAEDELIDEFWAGELSEGEVQQYRKHFLVTRDRRLQHRLGDALREHVAAAVARDTPARSPEPVPLQPFGRFWLPLAAAATALVVILVWLLVPRPPFRLVPATRFGEGSTVSFFLATENLRSLPPDTGQVISVPDRIESVDLQLDLPNGSSGDREVTLENVQTDAIVAEGTLPAETIEERWVVVVRVPSERLTPGNYRVILQTPSVEGEHAVERTYTFRVASP